jgi:hypothetical protein
MLKPLPVLSSTSRYLSPAFHGIAEKVPLTTVPPPTGIFTNPNVFVVTIWVSWYKTEPPGVRS